MILDVLKKLDQMIQKENDRLRREDQMGLPKVEITIFGQISLLSDEKLKTQIKLFSTYDVDAVVKGVHWIKVQFEKALKRQGFDLDPVSDEIWIPPNSEYVDLFVTEKIVCKRLGSLYVLVSKAIKAKEKNRILVGQAIQIYGEKLAMLIKKYGGDIYYFRLD